MKLLIEFSANVDRRVPDEQNDPGRNPTTFLRTRLGGETFDRICPKICSNNRNISSD